MGKRDKILEKLSPRENPDSEIDKAIAIAKTTAKRLEGKSDLAITYGEMNTPDLFTVNHEDAQRVLQAFLELENDELTLISIIGSTGSKSIIRLDHSIRSIVVTPLDNLVKSLTDE